MKRTFVLAVAVALLASGGLAQIHRTVRAPQPFLYSTINNNAPCAISVSPAATLLLPYFEVEIDKHVIEAKNTIFSVVNTSKVPQIARVTVWSDEGYPALWFNIFLTGYGVQPISMYDVIGRGVMPVTSSQAPNGAKSMPNGENPRFVNIENCGTMSGELPPATLTSLQSVLTNGPAASTGCRVGSKHENAAGYVTVDVVTSCSSLSPLDISY